MAEVFLSFFHCNAFQLAGFHHLLGFLLAVPLTHRLQSKVGIHGVGSVANEAGKVMRSPCSSRLHDDSGIHAKSSVNEAMMHCADSKERGDVG
jgi:hypothetical protein